jgi:predicted transcriptional regulator
MTPAKAPDITPIAIYEQHYQFIHSIFSSRLKVQILLTLLSGSCSLAGLRDVTGSTSQALIPKIRTLESLLLVEMKNDYELTPFGKIIAARVADYVILMGSIDKYRDFWSAHDLSGIPLSFLEQIGDLYGSEIKLDNQVDIMSVYSNFLKILKEGVYIHGISSVMSPGIAELLTERIISGTPVELVVSEDLIPKLNKDPYTAFIREVGSFPNFKVYATSDSLRVGITVTDRMLSLGLFKLQGNLYDSSSDIFSSDRKAVSWGERLFQYYRRKSYLVSFSG